MIDEMDQKILSIIQNNARTSNAEIARQVGMAPSAVLERIRKLEEKGIIEGYEVRVNPRALGLGLVAFISVRTRDPYGSLETAESIAQLPEVLEVHHTAGEDCYLVKVRTRDTESLGRFLRQKLGGNKNVTYTRTTIVLDTLKESTQLSLNQNDGESNVQ
jgi:Lrp/AsnC family leucine-responsive transcriptional regulator